MGWFSRIAAAAIKCVGISSAKCDALNRKIDHDELLLLTINQKTAADVLNVLIARHEVAKRALHPEAGQNPGDEGGVACS